MVAEPLFIPDEDIRILTSIASSRTEEARKVQRANILLMASKGETRTSISKKLNLSRPTINLCINKYREAGLEMSLNDTSRTGRPSNITPEGTLWIQSVACQKPKDLGYAQELWTIRKLTKHIRTNCEEAGHPAFKSIVESKVWNILNNASIKPHKIRYYLERRDPEFEAKMQEVLCVYKQVELMFDKDGVLIPMDLPKTVTISYDEKPGIQAIANVVEDRLPTTDHGFVARDSEYKRLGTVSLLVGIDLLTGEILPLIRERHKSSDFVEYLKMLDCAYDSRDTIRLILDNHSIHTSKETREYLATVPERFIFVFTPTHGSWLNLIEGFISKLTRACLRGIRVKSKEELVQRLYQYMSEINKEPVVHRWTYKMDKQSPGKL